MTAFLSSPPRRELLVCTDASPASQGVFEAALALAQREPCRIRLLQVLEYNPGFASLSLDALQHWEAEARTGLEALRRQAEVQGLKVEVLVSRGEAAPQAILAEVDRRRPDFIVVGRRGRSDLKSILLGSVTSRVIGLSPVPILVVPRLGPFTFGRPLLASDGSTSSKAAVRQALALARTWSMPLLAVSAAQKEEEYPEVEAILEKLQEEAKEQGAPLTTHMVQGQPADAILRAAEVLKADLLILGSHGRTGLKRLFLGSVAEGVVGRAACPVLIVKHRD
jgi:nucleotide-binding universal stress UspA family protein